MNAGASTECPACHRENPASGDRGGDYVITNDSELLTVQARVQVVQAMLAHSRRTCTPETFQDQAKSWLNEWQRLDEDIRDYLSTPPTRAAG